MPLSALIGGVANVASNIIGAKSAERQTKATNATNLRIAQDSFEHNKEMWKLENEYNSPANQLARYKDAGLNPNLMVGSISPGNASNAPQMTSPRMDSSAAYTMQAAQNIGNAFQNIAMTRAQIDNIKANTRGTDANTDLTFHRTETERAETRKAIADAVNAEVKANVSKATEIVLIATEYQKLDNLTAQEKETYAKIARMDIQNELDKANISWQDFQKGLQREELALKKRIHEFEKNKFSAEYGLKYDSNAIDRYNAETARLKEVQNMYRWTKEYNAEVNKENFNRYEKNRRYDLDKATRRTSLFNPSSWFSKRQR